jgi:hypothetical protein
MRAGFAEFTTFSQDAKDNKIFEKMKEFRLEDRFV